MKLTIRKLDYKVFKRLFDIIFGLLLLFFLSPFVIISAFLLAIDLKENPFFLQKRPGLNEKIFFLLKLKTIIYKSRYQTNK